MKIFTFLQSYIDQITGQFTQYDESKAIIVIPTIEGRYQTILLLVETSKTSTKQRIVLTSKVCDYSSNLNLKTLLEQNALFDYSKFILEDDHLKVEASCLAETVSEEELKHMVQEVAKLADSYEMSLTGKDIH